MLLSSILGAVLAFAPAASTPSPKPRGKPPREIKMPALVGQVNGHEAFLRPKLSISVNSVYNTGSVIPTHDSPVAAVMGSAVGTGLPGDGNFLITARQTRFGLEGGLWLSDRIDAKANLEMDFFGLNEGNTPAGINQAAPRLRLAWFDLGGERVRLHAGQDVVVFAPRLPISLSHQVVVLHSLSGAVWNRLPQIAGKFRQPLSSGKADSGSGKWWGKKALTADVAIARPFSGNAAPLVTRTDVQDPGTAGQLPFLQAHFGFDSEHLDIGVGGHLGRERYVVTHTDGGIAHDDVPTWMASFDVGLDTEWVHAAADIWTGANLDGLNSSQGVVLVVDGDFLRDVSAAPAAGGWAELAVRPGTKIVQLVTSGGADVGDKDYLDPGTRWLTWSVFGAIIVSAHPNFDVSVEYLHTDSRYNAPPDAAARLRQGLNDSLSLNLRFKL